MFPAEAKPRGTLRSRGNKIHCFPRGQSFKCFVIPSDSNIEKAPKKMIRLTPLHTVPDRTRKIERLPKPTCPIEKSR